MEENRTLLIVDDEPDVLKGYQEFLAPLGRPVIVNPSKSRPRVAEQYRLLFAKTGEEAIKILKSEQEKGNRIAAGFFSVKLGQEGLHSLVVIRAAKAIDQDMHFIIVTDSHDQSLDKVDRLFGETSKDQWDYLVKPFTQGEIIQKARQAVSAWNQKRQLELMTLQLVRSERLASIGQIARGVGHEFGNILQRIMGKLDLAMIETDPKKSNEHLELALKAVERAGAIIRNLQSFSKSETKFQFESILVPLEKAISLVSHDLIKGSIRLVKDYHEVPPVLIEGNSMEQVFINVLINMAHAMPRQAEIKLKVDLGPKSDQEPQLGVAVQVVSSEVAEFSLSPGGEADGGLGLSISKSVLETHGGQIQISFKKGKGAELSIWLPLTKVG